MRTSKLIFFSLPMLFFFVSSCSLVVDFDQKAKETLCNDTTDNDGDKLVDCDDPDCRESENCNIVTGEICDDATDNDGDGFVDCDDPDCRESENCNIVTGEICGDGVDNDGDGFIDCDDPDCKRQPACNTGMEICGNYVDDDGDEMIDCVDPDCSMDPNCITAPEICNNGMDDDADGMIDCEDSECSTDPACLEPCNNLAEWTGIPDEYYFSEVFRTDDCPPDHVCSIRSGAEYPLCYPVVQGEALQGPLATCGPSNNGLNCQEGLMCAWSEHSQMHLCLPHCAPGTEHGCPTTPLTQCYVNFYASAGPDDPIQARVFLCDRPGCDIFKADTSCGTSSTCIPAMERYGNGNCHPRNPNPVQNWAPCNGYTDCRAGWVCEQGSQELSATCHPICRPGGDPCPSVGVIATQCRLRDPRDAWGICDD